MTALRGLRLRQKQKTEMDAWGVISNMDTNEKIGLGGSTFDIFNHVLDNYYLAGDATFDLVLDLQEEVAEHACGGGVINGIRNLNADDVENIYKMCL